VETWIHSISVDSQIQTWVNSNSQLYTLKFNMGELKFKYHVDELSNLTRVSSNSQLCTLVWFIMVFHFDHLFVQILYFKIYLRKKTKKLLDGLPIPCIPLLMSDSPKKLGKANAKVSKLFTIALLWYKMTNEGNMMKRVWTLCNNRYWR
jgi:hypothetical protein